MLMRHLSDRKIKVKCFQDRHQASSDISTSAQIMALEMLFRDVLWDCGSGKLCFYSFPTCSTWSPTNKLTFETGSSFFQSVPLLKQFNVLELGKRFVLRLFLALESILLLICQRQRPRQWLFLDVRAHVDTRTFWQRGFVTACSQF